MNSDMEKYYAINKLFLSRVGGWPYQQNILKILLPCIFILLHYSTIVTQILLLYDTWGDINIAVECTCIFAVLFAAHIKLINILVHNDKLRRLLLLMKEHWELFNNENDRHTLRCYASISKKFTRYFGVYYIITFTSYLLIPMIPRILDIVIPLNDSRPLTFVYQAEYRIDKQKFYYLIISHSYATTIVTATILFTVDTTYVMCVLHACSLFKAISRCLENITGETDVKLDDEEKIHTGIHHLFMEEFIHGSVGNDYRELRTCLKKHQLALEHVKILDSTFTQATFIILCLNVLILSIIGIQVINNRTHTDEIIRYGFVSLAGIIHLICLCIPGQLLIDHSTEVFDKAYGSAWHLYSIKTTKLLRILLYRSIVPCELTAGKYFVMSMTMFISVMKTAISYFTTFLSIK